jgi:uncharacterized delta-60 repeat protein
VARLNANGSLDTAFHGTGIAALAQSGTQEIYAVAIQSDGKLLLGGYTSNQPARHSPRSFAVARLFADGTPDTTYGADGTGVVTFPNGPVENDDLVDVAIQSDGKLLGVGEHFTDPRGDYYQQVAAVRLDTAGAFDTTFGANGLALIPHNTPYYQESARRMLVLPDQQILVAGTGVRLSGSKVTESMVLRIGTNGQLDTTFGTNGWTRSFISSFDDTASSLGLDANGNIYVAGEAGRDATDAVEDTVVARLTSNGALDTSFGTQGRFLIDFSEGGTTWSSRTVATLVQPDGRVIVVGRRGTLLQPSHAIDTPTQRIVLARLCEPTVQLISTPPSVSESAGNVNLTVRRSCGAATGPVSVNYTTKAGTASSGSDFTASTGTLTWAAGDADEKTLTIQLPGDTADEQDEQFSVELSAASGGTLLSPTTLAVTLTDDDEPAPPPPSGGNGGTGTNSGSSSGAGGALDYALLLGLLAIGLFARRAQLVRTLRSTT